MDEKYRMEANSFVEKIKANGSKTDVYDLSDIFKEYKVLLGKLSQKDKVSFSLNVLLVLCRNLTKVPVWSTKIDSKQLLELTIECVRQTRSLELAEQIKILACIYNVHKHVIKVKSSIPPELVLKLSFMPFENEDDGLVKVHNKTFVSLLIDRLAYLEQLKSLRMPIVKLLPKLTQDLIRLINVYDTTEFYKNYLHTFVKRLYVVFNDSIKELNEAYGKIFECISKKNVQSSEQDALELYVKLNDVLFTITESSLKNNFKNSILEDTIRTCIKLFKGRPDMFHCFQTFYLNSFCCIFKYKTQDLTESVLHNLVISFDMSEKLGYKETINATYPYISQLLRLYLENVIFKEDHNNYNEQIQDCCLNLALMLMDKLKNCCQLIKCENCKLVSGLHDSLRLSFFMKNFITRPKSGEMIKNSLSTYVTLVEKQYEILRELKNLNCVNVEKYFRKLQTDVHNTAIALHRHQYNEMAIKFFEIYIVKELNTIKNDDDLKNIYRALNNLSICQLEIKMYKEALKSAFLCLIFSYPECLKTEKCMNLIIDIKAKSLENEKSNELQTMTILDFSKLLFDDNSYGDLKMLIRNIKFRQALEHEFSMYVKTWASLAPVAGVCKSLYELMTDKQAWMCEENKDKLVNTLYEKILEVPSVVRILDNDCYKNFINLTVERFEKNPANSTQAKLIYATLLFLKSEFDLTEASEKHEWKIKDVTTTDLDQITITRTIEQEHKALQKAFEAVDILVDILPSLKSVKNSKTLHHALAIWQVFVQQFMFLQRLVYGLQLALICCQVAQHIDDKESFLRNASVILTYMDNNKEFENFIQTGTKFSGDLVKNLDSMDTALCFLCDAAIYYAKKGSRGFAAKLVQYVQTQVMSRKQHIDVHLQLTLGRLMYAQYLLKPDSTQSMLSLLSGLQKYYLALTSNTTLKNWSIRRTNSLCIWNHVTASTVTTTRTCRQLRVLRRAVTSARPLTRLSAASVARIYCEIINTCADDAQVKIDYRVKYIIGMEKTTETQTNTQKQLMFTPKHTSLETVRDAMLKKTQLSPSIPLICPSFKSPDFISHKSCICHVCDPACIIVACHACYLESSTFYRLKDVGIAKKYFAGTLKTFLNAEGRLKNVFNNYRKKFNAAIVDMLVNYYGNYFKQVKIEFLIELSYFELSQNEFEKADEYIVRILEIISEIDDSYIKNEFHNLMVASAKIRQTITKPEVTGLEIELENLKISPTPLLAIEKTPENKVLPKPVTPRIVKDEEIPKKIKGIKLNFDDKKMKADEVKAKSKFKIPVPVTSKPVLETITPRPSRSRKPDIVIEKASPNDTFSMATPKSEVSHSNSQFFTPAQSSPNEQFFTPMTSLKTYSKRIVKNLDTEFSTPNLGSKKVETGSVKSLKEKRLKRATSPGKLVEEKPVATRSRRIRQPILKDN